MSSVVSIYLASTAFSKDYKLFLCFILFCILSTTFLLGTNNDSFDDNDGKDGGGGGFAAAAVVADGVGDGDESDSCIGRSRTCSGCHFVTYVTGNIMTILVWFLTILFVCKLFIIRVDYYHIWYLGVPIDMHRTDKIPTPF